MSCILQRCEMISLSKDLLWSLWILAGIPKTLNLFSTRILATVRDFWLFVMKAWLYLEKASVRTRIFSLPPFTTSAFVKSIERSSKGWCVPSYLVELLALYSHPLLWHTIHIEWASSQCLWTLSANILCHVIAQVHACDLDDHCHHEVILRFGYADIGAKLAVEFHYHPWKCNDAEHPILMIIGQTVIVTYK